MSSDDGLRPFPPQDSRSTRRDDRTPRRRGTDSPALELTRSEHLNEEKLHDKNA